MRVVARMKDSRFWQWLSKTAEGARQRFEVMQENIDLYNNMLKILLGFFQVITFLFLYAV